MNKGFTLEYIYKIIQPMIKKCFSFFLDNINGYLKCEKNNVDVFRLRKVYKEFQREEI